MQKGENNGYFKVTSRFGLLLGFIALVCTAVSAGIYMLTKDKIDEAMAEQQKALLLQVIPQDYFNNNLLESVETPEQDKLKGIQKLYFAIKTMYPLPMPMKRQHQMVIQGISVY